MKHIKKLWARTSKVQRQQIIRVAFIIGFMLIGIAILGASRAGSPTATVEPEEGTRQGVTTFSDPTASGGSAVKFGMQETSWQSLEVTDWATNASPAAWNPATYEVLYNKRNPDNMWDGYAANPDGSNEHCVTCTVPNFSGPGTGTHRGISDVTPDGKYMIVTVEGTENHFEAYGTGGAEPGKGAYNDLWLYTANGSQAWRLTNRISAGVIGVIWPRFDRTGTKLIWSEMLKNIDGSHMLGTWQIKTAELAWDGAIPKLINTKSYKPDTDGKFYEPYGFSPNGDKILFASDYGMPWVPDAQIFTANSDLQSAPVRLSPADSPTGLFSNYNEFAFWTPDGKRIIYGRTRNAESGGLDYWSIKPDGTDNQRLTFLNLGWHAQTRGYAALGGMAFDPRNPNRLFVGVSKDSNSEAINAVMITLNEGNGGLRGEYFSDDNLQSPVTNRVENPSSGFNFADPPANGVPKNDFSARWTGKVRIDTAGTYQFCVYLDDGGRLWVNGQQIFDSWFMFPGRKCGTIALTTGSKDIRLEYRNGAANGGIQLLWTKPGGVESTIPGALLSPGS